MLWIPRSYLPGNHLLILLLPVFFFTTIASSKSYLDEPDPEPSSASDYPSTITLHKWPLRADSPSPIGQVGYNPKTKAGTFFPLPDNGKVKVDEEEELVRIGALTEGAVGWFGTVVEGKALNFAKTNPIITLHIDDEGKAFYVEFANTADKSTPSEVYIVPPNPGPTPHLNKPIMLDPDGKIPAPPVEKTLLQKYWWVLLAAVILLAGGGGGGEQ